MDDEIIYSWCFNDVECFDSTPSAAIIILDKDLESFSSLKSQQLGPPILALEVFEGIHLQNNSMVKLLYFIPLYLGDLSTKRL